MKSIFKIYPIITFLFFICVLLACKSEEPLKPIPKPGVVIPKTDSIGNVNTTGLKNASPFPFGAALNISSLKTNSTYRATVIKEFNSLTAENVMKMNNISLSRGNYKWTDADYLVDFAQKNNMRIHGHALVWYNSTPTWITNFVGTKDDWKAILREYILAVVGRYKGKIQSWDVLNEAILDDGTPRNCIWKEHIGMEYIDLCFQYAREADPNVLLFYNDYGNEYSQAKRIAINNLVNDLLARGIPIDGIGLQMHTSITRSDNDIRTAINTAAQTGLKIHVSEFDIRTNTSENVNLAYNATLAAAQKQKYKVATKVLFDLPASQRYGFTFWGVYDGQSWIPGEYKCPDWPLPFDEYFVRKDAYYGVLEGLK